MVRAARDADHGQQASGGHAEPLTGLFDEDGLLAAGQVFRACISASLRSIDATASARPAASRGPPA